MCYKIVSEGQIVDVCSSLNFVRFQKKNRIFLASSKENATGIVTSDGSSIYVLDGSEPVENMKTATFAEISDEDYDDFRQQLIDNGVLRDTIAEVKETLEESSDNTGHEPVAKSAEMLLIEKQQEQIDFLTECILEMSESVYG